MKFIYLYFVCFFSIFSNDIYMPKSKREEDILNKYRKQSLTLGLSKYESKNEVYSNESLNQIIQNLFKDYLQLSVNFVKKDWNTTQKEYRSKKIDILGFFTETPERKENYLFTTPIFNQDIYIASNTDSTFNLTTIKNKQIYVLKNSIHSKFFLNYLHNSNIYINSNDIKDISKLKSIKNNYYIGMNDKVIKFKYIKKIGTLPGVSISLQKKYKDLLPIINTALNEKYKKEFDSCLENRKNIVYKENFFNSLTTQERKYLETLKPLNIFLENNIEITHYSTNSNKYIGSLALTLEKISAITGIKFNILENKNTNWNNIFYKLKDNKIDMLPLAKTDERLKYFTYTKQIDFLKYYKISSFKSKGQVIGSLDNSIEKSLVDKIFFNEDTKLYKSRIDLKKGLQNNEIKNAFLLSYSDLDMTKYNIDGTEIVPIYLVLSKNNEILKDILNKAIDSIPDKKTLKEKADLIRGYDMYLDTKRNEKNFLIVKIYLFIFFIVLILILYKLFYQSQIVDRLKKDHLTQLPSRYEFNRFKIKNSEKLGCTILIDIDKFKEINDRYGHYVGDNVIISISNIIKKIFPQKTSFRISGDEFYIFVETFETENYLIKLKNEFLNCKDLSKYIILSLSIGYFYKNNKDISMDEAFRYADMAMYEAKKIEDISYVEATKELIEKKDRENTIKTLLREADIDEIYPVYQPKFNIKTNEIVGAEALARWNPKNIGFIYPGEFIPLAEEIKSIYLIDFRIAEEAIKTIKKWKNENLVQDNFKISFNVSMETFERHDVIDTLVKLLNKYDVPGEWLEIEITESILSSNLNKTLQKLKIIKGLKIHISIDDFTAGHSTASLLPYLPVSIVKFDKSILDIIDENNIYNHSIYKNLISLVKDLNLKIVAEGIETKYQLNFLKEK